MSKFPWPKDLKNINDVVSFLGERIYNVIEQLPKLSKADQENAAAGIVHLFAFRKYEAWSKEYPILGEIVELAADLEWSNFKTSEEKQQAWDKMQSLTATLKNTLAS